MELRFFGATGDVTGSCHLVSAGESRILLDCGLHQGRREEAHRKNRGFEFDAPSIDAVIQSHAHIDHSGKLPLLVREGFRGSVHATHGTRDLCGILLLDSAHIQVKDAQEINRRRAFEHLRRERRQYARIESDPSEGLAPAQLPAHEVLPLYLAEDVRETMGLFSAHRYLEWFQVARGMRCRFHDAGHILGSAWVELEVTEGERVTRLVFTGDYGRPGQPVLRDPEPLCDADVLISESTYGNRSHPQFGDTESELGDAVERLARRGAGRLLIPVFAVGRAQNLLYTLARVFRMRKGLERVHVVVDSPLATAATEIVASHPEYFDEEARAEFADLRAGGPLGKRLQFTAGVDASKALNHDPRPLVILAASGMMESGRIVHHLAWNVSREDCELLVVGYQARNTLGRKLLDGAGEVNLLGRRFAVHLRVTPLMGFSAHADREGLLAALTPHARNAKALFLVHGENDQRDPLARTLAQRGFARVETPDDSRVFAF